MRCLVLGAGVSGLAAARLAASLGDQVCLSNDKDLEPQLKAELAKLGIKLHIGPQDARLLDGIDTLIVSPGINDAHPVIASAKNAGLRVISEIDLALSHVKGHVITVTGTNGKSTTTAMVAHILNRLQLNAVACGNIGLAPSQILVNKQNYDYWVIELSSYQISVSQPIASDAVIFTSFSPDHLARHGTVEEYFNAKARLCFAAKPQAVIALSGEAADAFKAFNVELTGKHLQVLRDDQGFDFSCTPLHTKHDRLNALLAAISVSYLHPGYQLQQLINLLNNFSALPFRYNLVGRTHMGHMIINDSKATNVDSCLRALENQETPCLLMIGGQGKGESYAPIAAQRDKIAEAWCFGASGKGIASDLSSAGIRVSTFATLKDALAQLRARFSTLAYPVLFSPACASFDEFKNFEDRGFYFNKEIKAYAKPV